MSNTENQGSLGYHLGNKEPIAGLCVRLRMEISEENWFTLHMPAVARAEAGRKQELGTRSGSPKCMAGIQALGHILLPSQQHWQATG